jgi:biopolymer transport protein ExbD
MRKFWFRSVAILTFAIGVVAALIFTSPILPPNDNFQVVTVLTPAREWHPMVDPNSQPFPSSDFMIVQQSISQSITEPISESLPDSSLIDHDCGTLTISIDSEGNLLLNMTENIGTSNDTAQLTQRLTGIFNQRIELRAYLRGMETRTDLSDIERIPRTVLIRASRSNKFGDVIRIIEVLKGIGAKPIGLQINNLPA